MARNVRADLNNVLHGNAKIGCPGSRDNDSDLQPHTQDLNLAMNVDVNVIDGKGGCREAETGMREGRVEVGGGDGGLVKVSEQKAPGAIENPSCRT